MGPPGSWPRERWRRFPSIARRRRQPASAATHSSRHGGSSRSWIRRLPRARERPVHGGNRSGAPVPVRNRSLDHSRRYLDDTREQLKRVGSSIASNCVMRRSSGAAARRSRAVYDPAVIDGVFDIVLIDGPPARSGRAVDDAAGRLGRTSPSAAWRSWTTRTVGDSRRGASARGRPRSAVPTASRASISSPKGWRSSRNWSRRHVARRVQAGWPPRSKPHGPCSGGCAAAPAGDAPSSRIDLACDRWLASQLVHASHKLAAGPRQRFCSTNGRFSTHPDHDWPRRRVCRRIRRVVAVPRPEQADAREDGALRVRHAGRRRRARAAVGQVLPGRDDLPALRHRSRVPLSLGDRVSRARAWSASGRS